jgi:hypothetical protein
MKTRPLIPLCRNTLTVINEKTDCNKGIFQSLKIFESKLCVRNIWTASMIKCSEFLATDPEVPVLVPGATRFSEK